MGIYDRDYYRDERPQGLSVHVPRTIVGWIIALNVALWLIDLLVQGRLSDLMAVHVDTLTKPWLWWQFLSAGFAHSPDNIQHILMNMLGLFFLGPSVEEVYGRKEFLRLYLAMVVLASVVWNVANVIFTPEAPGALGASGAITGVMILYALNFPHNKLLLFFVIPIPAWFVGVFVVGSNILGMIGQGDPMTAYSMHLTGAAFALLYFYLHWNLTQFTFSLPRWASFRRRPKLRIHTPDEEPSHPDLRDEVDRILEKIYRDGEGSLTAKERKTLEMASREYQQKKTKN